jgi:hypothetical protein
MFTLTKEYISSCKTKNNGFTKAQLAAIGVAWPPVKGWTARCEGKQITMEQKKVFESFAFNVADLSKLSVGKPKNPAKPAPVVTKTFTPLCNCNVLPWEDCEHTDALAHKAMLEMTGQVTS